MAVRTVHMMGVPPGCGPLLVWFERETRKSTSGRSLFREAPTKGASLVSPIRTWRGRLSCNEAKWVAPRCKVQDRKRCLPMRMALESRSNRVRRNGNDFAHRNSGRRGSRGNSMAPTGKGRPLYSSRFGPLLSRAAASSHGSCEKLTDMYSS